MNKLTERLEEHNLLEPISFNDSPSAFKYCQRNRHNCGGSLNVKTEGDGIYTIFCTCCPAAVVEGSTITVDQYKIRQAGYRCARQELHVTPKDFDPAQTLKDIGF